MIALAVFDLAGTTVRDGDAVAGCFRAALAAVGVTPAADAVTDVMGLPKPDAIRHLLDAAGRDGTETDAVHTDFVRRMVAFYESDPAVEPLPGAAAAFAALRAAGVKVALDTGFGRAIVAPLLTRLGWAVPATVDGVACSDDVPRGRPHPDMIRRLMAECGVTDPARVAKVGDTRADLEEGTNAGCGLVIGVLTGAFAADELRRHPHTHVVADVTAAARVILGG